MKRAAILLFFAGLLLGLTHCQKAEDGDTVILLGKEKYVIPLEDIIPDSLQTAFPSHLGDIPRGYIPPNVEGEYVISKKQFCYANLIPLHDDQDMHLRISNQHNRVANVELYEYGTVCTDTAFIMGSGQRFTLYLTEERITEVYGTQCSNTRCVVITGEKTSNGIRDLRFGNIILDAKDNGNPYISSYIPGMYFIYKDQDGLAENCDWFDHQTEGGRQ